MSDDHNNSQIGSIAAEAQRQFIERRKEEKKALSTDSKDINAQARSQGF